MKYLWVIFLIIAYIVAWVEFVVCVIDEIKNCKTTWKPNITDFIECIFSNDYVKGFLILHAIVLFIISTSMYIADMGGE